MARAVRVRLACITSWLLLLLEFVDGIHARIMSTETQNARNDSAWVCYAAARRSNALIARVSRQGHARNDSAVVRRGFRRGRCAASRIWRAFPQLAGGKSRTLRRRRAASILHAAASQTNPTRERNSIKIQQRKSHIHTNPHVSHPLRLTYIVGNQTYVLRCLSAGAETKCSHICIPWWWQRVFA